MTRAEKVLKILRESPDEKFSPWELAKELSVSYPEEVDRLVKSSRQVFDERNTPVHHISATIYTHQQRIIRLSKGKVKVVGSRPRKFYYTEKSDEEEIEAEEQYVAPQKEPLERELYGGIMQFLYAEEGLFCKRIEEGRSSNRRGHRGNKWLHPDIVGLQDLSDGWHDKVKTYSKQFNNQHSRLWSFEVKRLVNRSNVREVFFQAVSNSSWAHYGYLVGNFNQDALDELEILSSLHGIGVIQYRPDDEGNGIVIQARAKARLDWKTINRIVGENNQDFLDFMKNVSQFHKTDEVPQGRGRWDTVIEDD